MLELFKIGYRMAPRELEKIPREGPAVLVANHPFGAIEGVIMVDLTQTDHKLLARYMGAAGAARFLAHHAPAGEPGSSAA